MAADLTLRNFVPAHVVVIRMETVVMLGGQGASQVLLPWPLQPADHLAALYYVLYLSGFLIATVSPVECRALRCSCHCSLIPESLFDGNVCVCMCVTFVVPVDGQELHCVPCV